MRHQLPSDGSTAPVGEDEDTDRADEQSEGLGAVTLTPPRTDEGISSTTIDDDDKCVKDGRPTAAPGKCQDGSDPTNDMPDLVTMLAMSQAVSKSESAAEKARQTRPGECTMGSMPRQNLVWMMETGTGETLPLNPPPRPHHMYNPNLLYQTSPAHFYETNGNNPGGIPPHFHHLLAASSLVWNNPHFPLPQHLNANGTSLPGSGALNDLGLLNEAALAAGSVSAINSGYGGGGGGANGFPLMVQNQPQINPFLVPHGFPPNFSHHPFPLIPANAMMSAGGYSGKRCANCGATSTPSWRRCPAGKELLCNACGLYQKLHNKSRPFRVSEDGTIKVQRASATCKDRKRSRPTSDQEALGEAASPSSATEVGEEEKTCSTCRTNDTPLWRKVGSRVCCNACALFYKAHGYHRSAGTVSSEMGN